jgi:outer membrane receptor for ferrienterochelin and colicin
MRTATRFLLTAIICLARFSAFAQSDDKQDEDINKVTLEDLLKVTITSKKALTEQEAPGIITVISRDEIISSGARDLDDVLSLVPGFQFGSDYDGTVAVGIRGLWGLEGKLLAMIDGQEMNDLLYGSFIIINQMPLDQIDHIEIIRGPGSVIYGGTAEYSVMNIITRKGSQLDGAEAKVTYGQMNGAYARKNLSLAWGKKYSSGIEVSLSLFTGDENRSNKNRSYPDGTSVPMSGVYVNTPHYMNLAASYHGFSGRFIYSKNTVGSQDNTYASTDAPAPESFNQYSAALKYDYKLNSKITISPEYTWASSTPYYMTYQALSGGVVPAGGLTPFTDTVTRNKINVPVDINLSDSVNLLVGAEYFADNGDGYPDSVFFTNPANAADTSTDVHYADIAAYAQAIWNTSYGNFTLGARDEYHTYSGNSFVPRAAWTKSFGNFNLKALYSKSFRNPSPGDISDAAEFGTGVQPEKTDVEEIEVAYNFDKSHSLTLNVFETVVTGPMVYNSNNTYTNSAQTGSHGFELESKIARHWGYSKLTASYYNASENETPNYSVAQDSSQLAAFAPFTFTWNAKFNLSHNLRLNPWLVYLGHRYTYYGTGGATALSTVGVPEMTLANIFLNYENFLTPNLTLGMGLFNLFNANYAFLTAYDLGRNPMPGNSRELVASLNYDWHY